MRVSRRIIDRATRIRLPHRTVRLQLALLYGGLFLISGAVLLGITYALVSNATNGAYTYRGPNGTFNTVVGGSSPPPPGGQPSSQGGDQRFTMGRRGSDLTAQQQQAQAELLRSQARRYRDDQLHQLLTQSEIALGIMAVISVAMGWLVAGRVLRRVRTITTAAREISATNLHERLALSGPKDELKELGDTFDDLLARLDAAFHAQRQFIANASHELRTPLARQRAVAQVALSDPDATVESLRQAHERVLAAGAQQERLIAALLTLARGQAGLSEREPFDLASVVDQTVAAQRSEAAERGVSVRTQLATAPTSGDPRLAEQLAANLVNNALRHNVPGGQVQVTTRTRDELAVLSIANTGPDTPQDTIDRLFQPFQRLRPKRTGRQEGLGLGLSIVQAIATAHGATIEALSRPGGGLVITVSFPAREGHGRTTPVARPALTRQARTGMHSEPV